MTRKKLLLMSLLLTTASFVIAALFLNQKNKIVKVPSGEACGGLCKKGYICDYSANDPKLADAPGICTKLVLGSSYSFGGNPLYWNPKSPEDYLYLDENLKITIKGFTDECEKFPQNTSTTGCIEAGNIEWYFVAGKGNTKTKFSAYAKRKGDYKKEGLGYIFTLSNIDRFSFNMKVDKR